MRTEVRSGASQPDQVDRNEVYIQHDADSLSVLALWAGNKGDKRKCIVNHAVKTLADEESYQIKPEDRHVGMNTSSGVATATLPDPDDIEDGHEVRIADAGGSAGTNAITVATPGSTTVGGSATGSISTNDAISKYMLDKENTNWIDVS